VGWRGKDGGGGGMVFGIESEWDEVMVVEERLIRRLMIFLLV
jgi:hypothetical protein